MISGRAHPAVLRAIHAEGPIPFARFMEIALTDPETGYYTGAESRPTRGGDFLTAPELHPIFGAAVGRQLHQAWERLGEPAEFVLVEFGAGAGTLALAILAGLREDGSGLAGALRYQPIEVNPHRLRELTARTAVAGLPIVAPGEPVTGAILANEYLDALPVHLLEIRDGAALAVHVDAAPDGSLVERLLPAKDPAVLARLAALDGDGIALVEGQRLEVSPATATWAGEAAAALARGLVLVIDYGADATTLYGPRHRAGTLMTYREHRADGAPDAPYRDVGERDLTAHVDFTALERALAAGGLVVEGRTTQARFLAGCGLDALLERERGAVTTVEGWLQMRSAVVRLVDPRHLGGFGVVLASRGLAGTAPLAGLSFRG